MKNKHKLTEQQRKQLNKAAKPLIKWMVENCKPTQVAFVYRDYVNLHESIAICVPTLPKSVKRKYP